MRRRDFLQTTMGMLLTGALPRSGQCAARPASAQHVTAKVISRPALAVPTGRRAPFHWEVATVSSSTNSPLVLTWPDLPDDLSVTRFRIAVALDERDEKIVDVFLPRSGRTIGSMDLRFVSQFQPYELPLDTESTADVRREGLAMRLTKGSDLEVFFGGRELPPELAPHLLAPGSATREEEYFARMNSLACVQQFGWMEGCVLDGLLDLAELAAHAHLRQTAQNHLSLFIRDEQLVYENHVCAPSDGRIYGVEGTLPFAALARLEPQHPVLELAVRFWLSRRRSDDAIQDGNTLTSEGAYTVGYPLAEVGRARASEELLRLALSQVRLRQRLLFDGREFWRTRSDDGKRSNRNWARGIAWQILGLTRTLTVARERDDVDDLVEALREFAAWVISFQRQDGLWSVFVDDPSLLPDTAGSGGIAAALAIGAKHGWLDDNVRTAAAKTRVGLREYLTPDGFLGGVSQSNKGGEKLQRGNYRAIFQMGMGLQAQLIAALETEGAESSKQ